MNRTAVAALCLLATTAAAPAPRYGPWGVDYASMDRSVKPGDDFYRYAEGTWLRDTPIPADKTGTGYNYTLPDEAEAQVRTIVEEAERKPTSLEARKVGDFYAAWMDEAAINRAGAAPLKPYLDRIAAVKDKAALVGLMAEPGYAAPFGLSIAPDDRDPTHYAVFVGQAHLGLPTRDYYLLPDAKYVAVRKAYVAYATKLMTLAGMADAAAKAQAILALETAVSRGQWTPEQRRDPVAEYNPMTVDALAKAAPGIDWRAALRAAGLGGTTRVVVNEPGAVAATAAEVARVPLDTWKAWAAFRFVSDHARYLSKPFDDAQFGFYGTTINDVPAQRARWKRGMALIDASLGEAVGRIYVDRHWSRDTAAKADEMMADMRAAYREKIEGAPWMDAATKAQALAKLDAFDPRIGHPVKWIDYATLKVSRTDPLANAMASADFDWRLQLSRMAKPVDRTLWAMTPQTVNAYYDPTQNQVTVPAAILQPPFFDANADAAVNYGETGASTFGHEMGHGFDDQGRQYDAHGALKDWWTPATAARYEVKADRLAKQFDGYEPIPGTHIKGRLTLGENLADLGGLETAYAAYRRYVARHGDKVIDGFTGDQRFFLAYAQAWQGKRREGALRAQLLSDPHSPDEYRVNGIVRNFDPWYKAFAVVPGQKLYLPPAERVHIWE